MCFNLTRDQKPLYEIELSDTVDTELSASLEFTKLTALIESGATLTELERWYNGDMSPSFVDMITLYHLAKQTYDAHKMDAIELEKAQRLEIEKAKAKAKKTT